MHGVLETFHSVVQSEAELSAEDKERARLEAWNFVYIDTKSAFYQDEFDAANPNFTGRIAVDNYKVVNGQLVVGQ